MNYDHTLPSESTTQYFQSVGQSPQGPLHAVRDGSLGAGPLMAFSDGSLGSNQYDPPANYGIPNPLGPRLHNWRGGPLNEGSLFHGPVYTRPSYNLPRISRPVFGVETKPKEFGVAKTVAVGGVCFALAYFGMNLLFGKA